MEIYGWEHLKKAWLSTSPTHSNANMKSLLFSALVLLPCVLRGQTFTGDSLLANERSIDRPITLHARQVRISGGYGLQIISRTFDGKGKVVRLRDDGLASVRHRFSLDLKYGLNNFVQLNVAVAQSSNTVREQSHYIFPVEPEPVISRDVIREYSGLEDVYAAIDLRAPLPTRKLDVALTLGMNLPTASVEPAQPEHSFQSSEENGSTVHQFIYRYNNRLGKGVPIARIGGMIKYRLPRWAFSGRLDYQHGMKDGESFEWRHQLNSNGQFEYRRDPYSYRQADTFFYYGEVEFQPMPWFDIFINVAGHVAQDGWSSTASQPDMKLATPYEASWIVSPGFEIIVTPRLWLRERISYSVAGKNYEAPLGFETSLVYNFFPFR